MPDLKGQVVVITGASSGIGRAAALSLSGRGATVVINARRVERLAEVGREIAERGGTVLAVPGDITSEADRRVLVERAVAEFGKIDALVNNAGYGLRGPIEILPVEEIRRNFETNVFSLIALTQRVIPIMRGQGRGRIVNISSVAGRIARPFSSVYDATKHALEAISDGMRGELNPFGIEVIIIEPGFILTDFGEASKSISYPVLERDNVYSGLLDAFGEATERMRKMAGKPEHITRLVEKALTAGRPAIRYAAPLHARLFLALKWLLPDRVIDKAVLRQFALRQTSSDRKSNE